MENTAALQRTTERMPAPAPTDELIESFVDFIDRKPSTVRGYLKALRIYARWCSDNGVTNPTRGDLRRYRDSLAERGLTAATQRTYLQAARALHRWAAWRFGCEDISANLHGAKVRSDIHRREALEPEDLRKVIEAIDTDTEQGKRTMAIVLLASIDGLRTIEMARADVRDLQTTRGRRYLMVQGKGHDAKDQAKSLTPRVAQAIDDYLESRGDPWDGSSPLFVSTSNRNKGGRLTTTSISAEIKFALKMAGFDSPRLTAHSLRHTAATAAIEAGIGLREVQTLMSHANPATTEIYVHERDERRVEDMGREAIEAHLLGDDGAAECRRRIGDMLSSVDDAGTLERLEQMIRLELSDGRDC